MWLCGVSRKTKNMIPIAYNLDEARDFFLSHSSGQIKCVDGEREKIVDSFPEARAFFNNAGAVASY